MTSQESESLALLSRKVDYLCLGLKLISFIFLLVVSVGCIYEAFAIPRFMQIFEDALPGKPLPGVTVFVIEAHTVLFVTAIAFPLLGIMGLLLRDIRLSMVLLATALSLALIQTSVVVTALNLPMQGLLEGMSDGGK